MTSWWQKTLITAASLAGLATGTYYLVTRRPLPQKSGTLYIKALHESVKVITDQYGVPHIYAHNEDDLFFAQGYIHAQERLWQMELNRRLGAGQLAEIFGDIALETDRFCRRLGMHRVSADEAAHLAPHPKRVLNSYAQGVNAFIENHAGKLPVEFTLLGYKPRPWQPADTIQWSKMMGWNLGGNWETELIRARLVAKLGAERAAKLEAGYDPSHPLIVPPGVEYQGVNLGLLEQYQNIKELSGFGIMGGSNNWVVDGTMTETSAPMLCNDPHLGQAAPSIWFECHLNTEEIDVIGASFPGAPGVVIGHNQHIAWGLTNAVSDVQDLYIEKFNPQNPDQYEYQGQWENAQVLREEIKVKGRTDPIIEEVRITRHGPILTTMPHPNANNADNNGTQAAELPLALRWTGLEQGNITSAVLKLNLASNWDEFLDAMRDWDTPPQNVVYADRVGNIGYIMAGAIPIRAQGQALLPSPGWTGEYEWNGMIPFEELPQVYNPEQHFVVTANNRVIDDHYPYYITNEWLNGYRAQRIRDLLLSKDRLTLDDMAQIQADQYALPALDVVPYILKIEPATPLERGVQEVLSTWDYRIETDSIAATVYTTFLLKLERIVLDAFLGDDEALTLSYQGVGSTILATQNGYSGRSKPLLIRLLKEYDDSWFAASVISNGPKSWDTALIRAFQATIGELREKFGDNILRWKYGMIHKMTYNHALGAVKALEPFFNRGPYSVGGDSDTVNVSVSLPNQPGSVITVASYRQIVDLANLANSRSVHSPGQSGHPASKHYDDFIPLWRKTQYHSMLFTEEAIEAQAEGTLHMQPKH
jgi:penicillin amidase